MCKIAVTIQASVSYQYALHAQARALKQNFLTAEIDGGHIILVTCEKSVAGILAHYKAIFGDGWKVHHIPLPVVDGQENYKEAAQLAIAQMQTAAFDKARLLNVDFVWNVESDVIPEANNLRCMLDMLQFDGGYYDVAFVPYVSQGGGGIMGGRGTARHHILPNIYEDERDMAPELQERHERLKAAYAELKGEPSKELQDECEAVKKLIDATPPNGNVFTLNGKGWRQRGWFEWAYPQIGKGAVVPSDWMPMGNNLFSRKAIALVDFLGYEGKGTQDLYLCFYRLAPHGLKICVIPHCVSHHVMRRKDDKENTFYRLAYLFHEAQGECMGHLRHREIPWNEQA